MTYILCALSSIYFSYFASRSKDKGAIVLLSAISILIPTIIGGFRHYTVGTDSAGYGIALSEAAINSSSFMDYFNKVPAEPGCKIIFYFANIFGSYSGAFFMFELITMTCFYIGAYRHRKHIPLPFTMLVFYFVLYLRTYNEIRQSIAAAIIFMGLIYMEKRQYFRFSIHIMVATLFHYSALIAFPLLMGAHFITTSELYERNALLRIAFLCGTVIVLSSAIAIMGIVTSSIGMLARYGNYLNRIKMGYLSERMKLLYVGEIVMFILYRGRAKHVFKGDGDIANLNFYEFNAVFCAAYIIAVHFFDRILFYSDYVHMLGIASLPILVKEKNLRVIVAFATMLVLLVFFVRTFIIRPTFYVWPYKSVLI